MAENIVNFARDPLSFPFDYVPLSYRKSTESLFTGAQRFLTGFLLGNVLNRAVNPNVA